MRALRRHCENVLLINGSQKALPRQWMHGDISILLLPRSTCHGEQQIEARLQGLQEGSYWDLVSSQQSALSSASASEVVPRWDI